MRLALPLCMMVALLFTAAEPLAAQQAMRGNTGFEADRLPPGDDGPSSQATPLGFTINFFGRQFSNTFINHNGNISFDGPLSQFTPEGIGAVRVPLIAPFWADVDTRGAGTVSYGRDTVNGRPAFAATWSGVGYFLEQTNRTNTFQVVLIERFDTGPGNFDIEFNYGQIQWEVGEASYEPESAGANGACLVGPPSCVPASAGYSNGTGAAGSFYSIEGSLERGAFLDNNPNGLIRRMLNSNVPGRLVFQAREGQVRPSVISSLSPSSRAANSGDFDLTVNGSGFITGAQVVFGGIDLAPASITPSTIVVRILNSLIQSPGTVPVQVRQAGANSNTFNFTVTAAAHTISSISPDSAATGSPGLDLTINGTGFAQGANVLFGTASLTPRTVSATQIVVAVPANLLQSAGTIPVRVSQGGVLSNTVNFSVTATPVPQIISLSPNTRTVNSGDFQMTITGSNFGAGAIVRFGGDATLTPSSVSATQIVVTVANALIQNTGDYWVSVVQNQQASNDVAFRVTAAPVVIPPISVSGGATTINPGASANLGVTLSSPAPVVLTGTMTLTFTANASGLPSGYRDPACQFVSGGTTITFTVPAGATTATLPNGGAYNAGTVAGAIVFTITGLEAGGVTQPPTTGSSATVTVARTAPVITPNSVRIVNTSTGFNVEVQGHSTPRDLQQARFTFTASASGRIDGDASLTVDVNNSFTTWFGSATGQANGSRFLMTVPFTVTVDGNLIQSVSVTLTNSVGTSTAVSGGR